MEQLNYFNEKEMNSYSFYAKKQAIHILSFTAHSPADFSHARQSREVTQRSI